MEGIEWGEMTPSRSGNKPGDVIWPQALSELAMVSETVILILDGKSFKQKLKQV